MYYQNGQSAHLKSELLTKKRGHNEKSHRKKSYDTDTARLIVVLPCPHARHDFKWNETRVYQSPRGAYFLAGKGGASSRWAKATPRGSIAGAGIEVIVKDEALAYAKYAGLSPDRFARWGLNGRKAIGILMTNKSMLIM